LSSHRRTRQLLTSVASGDVNMTLHIRDVISVPETKPSLVVKVGEINDEQAVGLLPRVILLQ
jgi:hypothetical protein